MGEEGVTTPGVRRLAVARALSIAGHPALIVPLAGLCATATQGVSRGMFLAIALALAALTGTFMGLAFWQVRRGRWQHIDASHPAERRSLNFGTLAIFLLASVAAAAGGARHLSLAFACAALILAVAILASPALKLSQHVAFAVLATAMLWFVGPGAVAAGVALSAAIAWSRVELGRHVPSEIAAGAGTGALAGAVLIACQPLV